MYAHVAIHHPAPDRFEEVEQSVERIVQEITGAAGFHRSYVGADAARTQVFAITFWEEPAQFDMVLHTVQVAVDREGLRRGELREPEVIRLTESR